MRKDELGFGESAALEDTVLNDLVWGFSGCILALLLVVPAQSQIVIKHSTAGGNCLLVSLEKSTVSMASLCVAVRKSSEHGWTTFFLDDVSASRNGIQFVFMRDSKRLLITLPVLRQDFVRSGGDILVFLHRPEYVRRDSSESPEFDIGGTWADGIPAREAKISSDNAFAVSLINNSDDPIHQIRAVEWECAPSTVNNNIRAAVEQAKNSFRTELSLSGKEWMVGCSDDSRYGIYRRRDVDKDIPIVHFAIKMRHMNWVELLDVISEFGVDKNADYVGIGKFGVAEIANEKIYFSPIQDTGGVIRVVAPKQEVCTVTESVEAYGKLRINIEQWSEDQQRVEFLYYLCDGLDRYRDSLALRREPGVGLLIKR